MRSFTVTVQEERTCDRCKRIDTAKGTSDALPGFVEKLWVQAAKRSLDGALSLWSRPDDVDHCVTCTRELETWWRKVNGHEPLFVGREAAPPADAPPAGVERGVGATPLSRPTSVKRTRGRKVTLEDLEARLKGRGLL